MHYGLTTEQLELQSRARDLATGVIEPRAADVDRDEQYPWDNVRALKDAGFMGMTIPREYGGAGLSFLDAALVIEEMAKVCGVTGRISVEANMGAISAVMQYGTEAQKRLAAELVLDGDKPAICITEPGAGSAATEMTSRADQRGDEYVLNGKKHWITGGGVSRFHLIFARVFDEQGEDRGIGGFIAIRDEDQGLIVGQREPTMGLRGIPETEILFEDLVIDKSRVLMPPSGFKRGFGDLMNAYNAQRVGAGTVALGLAAGAYERARRFTLDPRGYEHSARGGAAHDIQRGAFARRGRLAVPRCECRRAGETVRLRNGDQSDERRTPVVRRERILAQYADRAHRA